MSEPAGLPPASTIAAWRVLLRAAGVLIVLFVFCFWAAKGYHRGWTQHRVQVMKLDPITEIEYPVFEDRFVPGLDYLGAGVFAGLLLFGVTFIPGRRPATPTA